MLDTPTSKVNWKSISPKSRKTIEITASLDDSEKSQEMREMLQEIASLSTRIIYTENNDDQRKPSFALNRQGEDTGIRFAGMPMGHEFTSLVLALLHVGGHPSKTSIEIIEQIRQLEGEYEFETYISLSCQNCPDIVQALNLMSIINPKIRHTTIDGGALSSRKSKHAKSWPYPPYSSMVRNSVRGG
jgi:NADH-dependent peroxiredoxin subunit F